MFEDCSLNATKWSVPYTSTEKITYTLINGTQVLQDYYCWNLRQAIWNCDTKFEGDSDIGGEGVFASYVAFAVITIVAATIKCFTVPEGLRAKLFCWSHGEDCEQLEQNAPSPSNVHVFAQGLLDRLCDIQIITGIGIVVAALTQLENITFYHYELAMNYWWLTLGSLFAGNPNGRSAINTKTRTIRELFRQWSTVITITLAIPALAIQYVREEHQWDSHESGKCYRFHPVAAGIPALLGLVTLCICDLVLIGQLTVPRFRRWLDSIYNAYRRYERAVICRLRTVQDNIRRNGSQFVADHKGTTALALILSAVEVLFLTLVVVISIFIRIFMSFCSLGASHITLEFTIFMVIFIITLQDIISMRLMNRPLLERSELEWGFGQVLPLVLIASLFFAICDAVDFAQESKPAKKTPAAGKINGP